MATYLAKTPFGDFTRESSQPLMGCVVYLFGEDQMPDPTFRYASWTSQKRYAKGLAHNKMTITGLAYGATGWQYFPCAEVK
jgi:hypothetical protein